ncbi:MAG TPA: IreB family regulatory phosphoprotein [Bacilli bacterium]|nr:IreB family regulatory phosphoprotein [Bacilli bacterium]
MEVNNTIIFDSKELSKQAVKDILFEVYDALEERGYDPIVQIVGYLVSGDVGYISNHLEARKKIQKLDREQILEVLLDNYLNIDK